MRRSVSPEIAANAAVVPLTLPFAGWNTRDQLSEMEPVFAQRLDNFYAEDGQLVLRGGYASHATGITGGAETLMVYDDGAGSELFAAGNDAIYDVTSAGAVSTAAVSSLNSDRWDWTMFSDLTNQLLVCANGADAVRQYNGTAWSAPSISGVLSAALKGVIAHKNRIWAIENGTLNVWYNGTTTAVAGTYARLPLGPLCDAGGELVALATWTRDGGSGSDDYFVAITSNGEVIVYIGTDPATTSWIMVGRFQIQPPLGGSRCVSKLGGDLVVLTRSGLVSMTDVLSGDPSATARPRLSGAIEPTFLTLGRTDGGSIRWGVYWHKRRNRVIVNAPDPTETVAQLVYSASSSAWCRLIGLNANDWVEVGDTLYFAGADGAVYTAETGTNDAGAAILGEVIFAPNKMGTPSIKHFRRGRFHYLAQGPVSLSTSMVTDYGQPEERGKASLSSIVAGAEWDTATWDVDAWTAGVSPRKTTRALSGRGITGALRVVAQTKGTTLRIIGAEISTEVGRVL